MTKFWQVYYHGVFGAVGALIAWQIIGLVDTSTWNVHLANLATGSGFGLVVGAALGIVDGALVRRSPVWTLIGAGGGAAVGALSGLLGLWLGGIIFIKIGGGLLARVLGWIVFGACLGAGMGAVRLSFKRAVYGVVGGALGGLLGGLLYELFTQLFLQRSEQVQMVLSALGLALMATALGVMIPLAVTVIGVWRAERGLIVYLNGPRQGTEIELVGPVAVGSSDACEVYVPDVHVEKRQAKIYNGSQGFWVRNIGALQPFYVDQSLVTPGRELTLPDGAFLQFGEISLRFQAG